MNKGREFFGFLEPVVESTASGKAFPFWKTEKQRKIAEYLNLNYRGTEKIHVIEYQAYKKAIDALKKFSLGESQWMDGVECMHEARTVLKELGEHE